MHIRFDVNVRIRNIVKIFKCGIEVDNALLENGKNGNFYIKGTDTG